MGLIAWYPLNGDTLDYSGKGNHLTFYGSTSQIVEKSEGKIGKCLERVSINTGAYLKSTNKILLDSDFTMMCWAYVTDTHTTTANGLISLHDYGTNSGPGITVGVDVDDVNYKISCSTGNGTSRTYNHYRGVTNIRNRWSHLTMRYVKETETLELLVDGVIEHSRIYSMYCKEEFLGVFVWGVNAMSSTSYKPAARLNDVRIYDHALSTKEVKEISKAKILHYKFDNPDATTIVRDCSGFGNDGIMDTSTAPTWTNDSKIGGGAMEFSGSNTISTGRLFYDNINQAHTVSAWVYLTDQTISNQQLINFHNGYCLIYSTSNNRSLMYMNSGVNDHYVYGSPIPINEWTLVTWVYDKENLRCQVYYNGVLDASSGNFTSSDEARGFSTTTIFGNNVKGKIDDIRIYATALSAEDIKELYEQRASVDNNGKLFLQDISETKFKPLLMDYTIWENGQTGSIGKFEQYSSSNSRVLATDPWGKETVVWQSKPNGGIYHSAIPVDNTKTYRMSWWEKRVNNTGTSRYYAGLNGYGSVNGVGNLTNTTPNTNPYFWSCAQNILTEGEWFLIVGHVHPHDYSGSTSPDSGRYTVNGRIGGISNDYRWLPQTTSARSRTLSVYQGSVPEITHYTVYPRMDLCDGTEPSITELLHGFDSRYIEKVRIKKNGVIGLDVGDRLTHIGEIREVGLPIRYIRDTVSGSTANSSNHWVEIQAYDINEVNIALGKSASSSLLTDGSTSSSPYYSGGPATVDLGSVEIVNYLKIWHYWADGRTYHDIKTEVSVDNVNWITVFDSNIDGEYKETSSGKTIILRPNELSIDSKGNLFINEIIEV